MSRTVAARSRTGKRAVADAAAAPAEPRRSGEIIDAAARVFASKGFHGASTQDIADVLGIRQASIYYYFPSKDVALEKVCLIGAEGFYERAKACFALVSTGERRLYGNIILKKGVIPPS